MKIAMLRNSKATFGELIRIEGIIASLRQQGHEVDVLAVSRREAIGVLSLRFLPFFVAKFWQIRRRLGFPCSIAFTKMVCDGILRAFYLIPLLRRGHYEVLLAETHYEGLCAWLIRGHLGTTLYTDFHGTADELVAHPAYYRQVLALEHLLVHESDLAISCSGIMRDHLVAKHRGSAARFIICHNGAAPYGAIAQHRSPLRAIYAGVFAYYQRVMDFVEAARLNTDPDIEFHLMGGGGNEQQILEYIKAHSIRITWLGYLPRAEALEVFATMQVGVLPTTNDIARQVASPIKILDYASCGLPVVTVAVGEWADVFREYDAGVVCAKCDAESLLAAIRSLKDKDRWTVTSQNAQRLIREARSWPVVLAPLLDHLRAVEASRSYA
jgi:glycosyltransferase involved in cell wall biosynthesis